MSKYLRMPPTRERRINRQRAELMSDMLEALRVAQAYMSFKQLAASHAYRRVRNAIERAEAAQREGMRQ